MATGLGVIMPHNTNSRAEGTYYAEGAYSRVVYVPWRVAQKARVMLKSVSNTKFKAKTIRSVVVGHRKGEAFVAMHDGRYMYYKELYTVDAHADIDSWECWLTGVNCINVFAKASQ